MDKSISGHREYVLAASEGRIEEAKRFLLVALRDARAKGADPVVAGLAQRLGTLLLASGDPISALVLYEISEDLDEGSLLTKLEYAKFLWKEMHDSDLAIRKCSEIVLSARSQPFPGSEEDFSSAEYAEAATRLLTEIQGRQA